MGYQKITAGAVATFITYVLTQYVPAWHAGLPGPVAAFLPAVVGLVAVFLRKEKSAVAEVEAVIARVEVAATRVEQGIATIEQVVNSQTKTS